MKTDENCRAVRMDHVVYLDYKAKELENLKSGQKTMIIRGAMGRKMPYGRINNSDVLYFIENKGDGVREYGRLATG